MPDCQGSRCSFAMTRLSVSVQPGSSNHRHRIPQHRRYRTEAVGGGHEQRLGQVERYVDVAVTERPAPGAGAMASSSAAAVPLPSSRRSISSRTNIGLRTPTRRNSSMIRPGGPEGVPCTADAPVSSPQGTHVRARPRAAARSRASEVLPTPAGPTRQSSGAAASGFVRRTAM